MMGRTSTKMSISLLEFGRRHYSEPVGYGVISLLKPLAFPLEFCDQRNWKPCIT